MQISDHIDIEFCPKIDQRCNKLYIREANSNYTSIRRNHQGKKLNASRTCM